MEAPFDPVSYLLSKPEKRFLLGITGVPGAGKSTYANRLAAELGPTAIVLPMDGFHYTNARLEDLGLRHRKGAPDTYDVPAFVLLLDKVRSARTTVLAPLYSRDTHEPEPDAIEITSAHRFVLVEGNYLLVWPAVSERLDETWFLDVSADVAAARPEGRHISVGRSEAEAEEKVRLVDMPNGEIVNASSHLATRHLDG